MNLRHIQKLIYDDNSSVKFQQRRQCGAINLLKIDICQFFLSGTRIE